MTAAPRRRATTRCRRPAPAGSSPRHRRRSTSTPTRPAPTASSRPAELVASGRGGRRPPAGPDRPRHAGRLPRGRRRRRRPGRPDAPARASRSTPSSPATSACGRASSTSSASGWTRPTRRSRRPSPPSATVAASGSSGRSRCCASSTCRSTPSSATSRRPTTTPSAARPSPARSIAAGHATSVEDAFTRLLAWGKPAYVPRSGLGPVEAIDAIRAAGGLPALAHFSEAPPAWRSSASWSRPASAGSRSTTARSTWRPSRPSARSPRSLGLVADRRQRLPRRHRHVRRGARRAVGPARGRRRHPGSARCRLAGTAMTERSTLTRALPMLEIVPPPAAAPRQPAAPGDDRLAGVPARGPDAAALPRLDARLPDEPQRLRGDGRPAAAPPAARRPSRSRRADLVVINTCAIREGAEQKVIGRMGQLARLKAANPGLRVVLTGCSVREPDRAGLRRRYPAVDLFLRPDEEPELVDRLGLASAQAPDRGGRGDDDGRRDDRRRSHDGRRRGPPRRHPGPRGRGGDRRARVGDRRLAADHLRLRQDLHLLHRAVQPRPGAQPPVRRHRRRGPGAGRRRLSRGHAARPERQLLRPRPRAGAALRARRRGALGGPPARSRGPAGPRRADPGDRRAADGRRHAGDRAPALRHLAPVGPVRPAHRGAGRLRLGLRAPPPARPVGLRRGPAPDGPPVHDRALPRAPGPDPRGGPGHRDLDRHHRRLLRRDRGAVRGDPGAARDRPLRPGLRGGLLAAARHARDAPRRRRARRTTSGAASTRCSRSRRGSGSSATRRGSAARSRSSSTRSSRRAATSTTTARTASARRPRRRCRAGPAATSWSTSPAPTALVGREVTVRIDHAGPYALRGALVGA